jgi:hypothetical protein
MFFVFFSRPENKFRSFPAVKTWKEVSEPKSDDRERCKTSDYLPVGEFSVSSKINYFWGMSRRRNLVWVGVVHGIFKEPWKGLPFSAVLDQSSFFVRLQM